MRKAISEADVEENVLDILKELEYDTIRGDNEDYQPKGKFALRADYKEVVIVERLRSALKEINPSVPEEAREQAIKQVLRSQSQKLIADNESFHRMLVDGIDVPVQTKDEERHEKVWLFNFKDPERNDYVAVNQFTVQENNIERRPDVVIFVNGIPLLIFELKNLADENATIDDAYNQFQTYKDQLPTLFRFNEILVISDGLKAQAGTISSERERFMQWKTINGEKPKKGLNEIEVLLRGMCDKSRFLDIIRNYIVFEKDKETIKKLAAYHQYWAANKAVESTLKARKGNKKAGIVWHTQGSGK
ncbi:MAG: type I restriction endonuclease, partial [Candidatus Nitrosotenuis sp.]